MFILFTLYKLYNKLKPILNTRCIRRISDNSQTCPKCGCRTGLKKLSERIHKCSDCGYQVSRDVAAAKVIEQRGNNAVGLPVFENACGDGLAGFKQLSLFELAKSH